MKIRSLPAGAHGIFFGTFAVLSPSSFDLFVNNLQALHGPACMGVRFLGLVALSIGASLVFAEGGKSNKVSQVCDAIMGLFCIYQWLVGIGSMICLTSGIVFLSSIGPLLQVVRKWMRKSPRSILYDMQRKRTFMENDSKFMLHLILGRVWLYIYDATKKNLSFVDHMNIVVNRLKSRFDLQFPWNGGIVYEQNGSENMATVDGEHCFVMSSSGYCAMSQQKDVLEYAISQARKAGPNYGSYAVIGFNEQVNQLHRTLEKYYQRDAAMVAASGYLACLNLIDFMVQSLGTSGDKSLVLMDRFSHPCLRYGSLNADKVVFFKHNDADDARRLLREYAGSYSNRILIIESVYSTDGDVGDLPNFRKVCDEFDCQLVLDDAHGLGVLGPNAGGAEDYWDMRGAADFICGTLSKSCSAQGGFVVSNNKTFVGALVMSPGVGFATAMNAYSAAYATKALESIMKHGREQVIQARELRSYFRTQLIDRLQLTADDNPTRLLTIRLEHPTRAMHVQRELRHLGFLISSMTFPAVPMHQSLLRMTIVPGILTKKVIDGFCDALEKALKMTDKLYLETNTHLLYNTIEEADKAQATIERRRALGLA